jgi:hypothetical protein
MVIRFNTLLIKLSSLTNNLKTWNIEHKQMWYDFKYHIHVDNENRNTYGIFITCAKNLIKY